MTSSGSGFTASARRRPFSLHGDHFGTWQGLGPTGRRWGSEEVSFIRIEDGRISGLWGLEDTWTRMHQLGADDATLGQRGSLG